MESRRGDPAGQPSRVTDWPDSPESGQLTRSYHGAISGSFLDWKMLQVRKVWHSRAVKTASGFPDIMSTDARRGRIKNRCNTTGVLLAGQTCALACAAQLCLGQPSQEAPRDDCSHSQESAPGADPACECVAQTADLAPGPGKLALADDNAPVALASDVSAALTPARSEASGIWAAAGSPLLNPVLARTTVLLI